MGRLDGKVAVVTGGGVGIGEAIVKGFVNEGAKVLITGRREDKLKEAVAKLPDGAVAYYAGDVTKIEDAEAMIKAAVAAFGKLNVLVNNAGIDPAGTVTEIPVEQWHAIINTNINGTFYMTRFAIPEMIKDGVGSIINVSSLAGVRAIPAMPAYSTSKAGLLGFANAVALDYGSQNIRINTISPGATATDMLKNQMQGLADAQGTDIDGALKLLTRFNPIKRAAEPDAMAPLAVFLASDESAFVTGQNILVDGGATVVDPCGAALSSLGKAWGGN